jgi:hypothetical protein
MLTAAIAELRKLKPAGSRLFVLRRRVIPLFAFRTLKGNYFTHKSILTDPGEEQAIDAGAVTGINHVGLYDQVFANEVCGIKIVGENATDFGRGHKDVSRTLLGEEALDRDCVGEVELSMRSQQEPVKALLA